MPKVSRWKLTPEELAQIREDLYAALTLLENKKEVRHFLSRFWTPTERVMFAKRFQLIMMIISDVPRDEIHNMLHISKDTISRIASKLEEQENKILIDLARRILELHEEKKLHLYAERKKRAPGDLATPLAEAGVKQLGKALFSRQKKRSLL